MVVVSFGGCAVVGRDNRRDGGVDLSVNHGPQIGEMDGRGFEDESAEE